MGTTNTGCGATQYTSQTPPHTAPPMEKKKKKKKKKDTYLRRAAQAATTGRITHTWWHGGWRNSGVVGVSSIGASQCRGCGRGSGCGGGGGWGRVGHDGFAVAGPLHRARCAGRGAGVGDSAARRQAGSRRHVNIGAKRGGNGTGHCGTWTWARERVHGHTANTGPGSDEGGTNGRGGDRMRGWVGSGADDGVGGNTGTEHTDGLRRNEKHENVPGRKSAALDTVVEGEARPANTAPHGFKPHPRARNTITCVRTRLPG